MGELLEEDQSDFQSDAEGLQHTMQLVRATAEKMGKELGEMSEADKMCLAGKGSGVGKTMNNCFSILSRVAGKTFSKAKKKKKKKKMKKVKRAILGRRRSARSRRRRRR